MQITVDGDQLIAGVVTHLIAGATPEQVADRLVAPPAMKRQVLELARAHASEPAVSIARLLAVRLKSAYWYFGALARLADSSGGASRLHVTDSLDRRLFLSDFFYRNRPVAIRGMARAWPAARLWSREYLRNACGNLTVEIMSGRAEASSADRNTADRLRTVVRWPDFLDRIHSDDPRNDVYLVSRNHFFGRPGAGVLLKDLRANPYVSFKDPGATRLWLGPAGTFTDWHHDDRNNLIVQIVGRKRVRLGAPCLAELMAQTRMWYAEVPAAQSAGGARLAAAVSEVVLEPGDALFIPVGWWHEVEALDVSATIACVDFQGIPNTYVPG